MNLTGPKNHVIIFDDKSTLFITKTQYDDVMKLSANKSGFGIDGSYYKFNSISKLLTEEEYYEQYPDRKPIIKNVFKSLPEAPMTPHKRVRALSEMIRGFKQYFKGKELPKNSQEMLNKMEISLQRAKLGINVNINPSNFS
jgi:hypothetical protein